MGYVLFESWKSPYLSGPTSCWDTIINMTKVKRELMSHVDMYSFFEKGMRSEESCISKRYSKAKIKYLNFYDPKLESFTRLCNVGIFSNKWIQMNRS